MIPTVTGTEQRSSRGVHGFTLVELVIVLALVGIVAGIMGPRLTVSASRRVEGMAHQMVSHLELARSHALGRRQMTRVVFDESALTYTAYVDDDRNGNIAQTAGEVSAFQDFGERDLEAFVQFGRGNADAIPGDPQLLAVTLASNTLDLSIQGLPVPWGTMGTIYLVHEADPDAVAAISVASSGSFKAWRWWPADDEWR